MPPMHTTTQTERLRAVVHSVIERRRAEDRAAHHLIARSRAEQHPEAKDALLRAAGSLGAHHG